MNRKLPAAVWSFVWYCWPEHMRYAGSWTQWRWRVVNHYRDMLDGWFWPWPLARWNRYG